VLDGGPILIIAALDMPQRAFQLRHRLVRGLSWKPGSDEDVPLSAVDQPTAYQSATKSTVGSTQAKRSESEVGTG
jgi:hypothetical protein